jgi:hypothetical protein
VARLTYATGSRPTAAQLNAGIRDQVCEICTSGSRPSSPADGQQIYETDTNRHLTYHLASTTWRPTTAVFVCTSTTMPQPLNGAVVYTTDTAQILVWDGTQWKQVGVGPTVLASPGLNTTVSIPALNGPQNIGSFTVSNLLLAQNTQLVWRVAGQFTLALSGVLSTGFAAGPGVGPTLSVAFGSGTTMVEIEHRVEWVTAPSSFCTVAINSRMIVSGPGGQLLANGTSMNFGWNTSTGLTGQCNLIQSAAGTGSFAVHESRVVRSM